MSKKPKPYGSLGLSGAMPRHKSEDEQKIEKILREEQDIETYEQVLQRQARAEVRQGRAKSLK